MWIEWIAYAAAVVLSVPVVVVCAECLIAVLAGSGDNKKIEDRGERRDATTDVIVLVPAHDEEEGLGRTLQQLKRQVAERDRLVVVADNCADATARVARGCGVECIERFDEQRRGKGYALDAGLQYLKAHPQSPSLSQNGVQQQIVVVMVDADCFVEDGAIEALVEQVRTTGRPAQAVYLMEAPPSGELGPAGAVSVLAFLVKNWVRPLGLKRFGGMPCVLTGTGMAFAWEDIAGVPLASGNIVEDMQLGLDLAERGKGPLLCEQARVTGVLPGATAARATQRRRWEHGHLRTIFTQVPRLWWAALKRLDLRLAVLGLDVAVPPLSLLVMVMVAGLLFAALLGVTRDVWGPAIILAGALALLAACVALAWMRFGRGRVPGRALAAAPLYAMSKVMLYASFPFKRERKWIRTERAGGGAGDVGASARAEIVGAKKAG